MIPPEISLNIKWYNPFIKTIKGLKSHMTTLLQTDWYGYKVVVKPHEWQRRIHYHHWYPPYMNDCQIMLKINITPPENNKGETIKYNWRFINIDKNIICGSGENTTYIEKDKLDISVRSEMLLDTDKYALEFQLIVPNKDIVEHYRIALLTVKERDEVTLQYVVPFLLSIITLLLSALLSIIVSIVMANILD